MKSLPLLGFLVFAPICAATPSESAAEWNVLPPRLSGSEGTLFFACKTATGLGPLRSIIADFTNGKSHEVPISPEDTAQARVPSTPSLRRCAADCRSYAFLTRVPEDADTPNPKIAKTVWYNFSLMLTQDGATRRVGKFAIGNPTASASGETYRFFQDLAVSPDANSFLLALEHDEYYFFERGDEHPRLFLSPMRWGREYCLGEKTDPHPGQIQLRNLPAH